MTLTDDRPASATLTEDWRHLAACRPGTKVDPETFHPVGAKPKETVNARAFCRLSGCPVIAECLAYALKHRLEGVWGGTDDRGRTQMRRATGQVHPGGRPVADPSVCTMPGSQRGVDRHTEYSTTLCVPCNLHATRRAEREERDRRIIELDAAGHTANAIAVLLLISRQTVGKVLADHRERQAIAS